MAASVTQGSIQSPDCQTIDPLSESPAISHSGTITWSQATYEEAKNSDGWLIYQLPVGGSPWGTAADAGNVWFTDQGRQKVGRFALLSCHELTLDRTGSGALPTAAPANSTGCPADSYVEGEVIDLSAVPAAGWMVESWSGTDNDSSASSTNTVTMPGMNHQIVVHYSPQPQYNIFLPLAVSQ